MYDLLARIHNRRTRLALNPGATRSDKDGYLDEVFISFEHKHKLNEKVGGE
jgi:hypothetical protein